MEKYAEININRKLWEEAQTLYDIDDLDEDDGIGFQFDYTRLGNFHFDDGVEIGISLESGSTNYFVDALIETEDDYIDVNDIDLAETVEIESNGTTYVCKFIITEE